MKFGIDNDARGLALAAQASANRLPKVTDADNGKVPVVVDGKWTASDLPDGNLPVVSDADNGDLLGVTGGAWGKVNPENVIVGNAEQIVSRIAVEDRAPYNHRTAGGSLEIGDRVRVSEITGATVVWNQVYPEHTGYVVGSGSAAGLTISVSDGWLDITGTAEADCTISVNPTTALIPANHVCMILAANWNGFLFQRVGFSDQKVKQAKFYKHTADYAAQARVSIKANTTYNIHTRFSSYDITLDFGSAIADYLLSLESGAQNTGFAKLKSSGFFTKDYYAYNAGSLESVVTSEHKTTGFNQFDESTAAKNKALVWASGAETNETKSVAGDYIRSTNNTYYTNYKAACFGYDANKNYIGALDASDNWVKSSGAARYIHNVSGAYYIRFAFRSVSNGNIDMTAVDDITVNLHWDGERDGEYEPYTEHVYPLDSSVELRGILTLDADNNIVADGDGYAPSGEVTRRYGIVDLGTLEWSWSESRTVFYAPLSTAYNSGGTTAQTIPNIICERYETVSNQVSYSGSRDKVIGMPFYNGFAQVEIGDSAYTDAATFKTAMSGVYLVYELATPTTESADPYQETQIVDNWGTEQYTDYAYEQGTRDVEIPVPSVAYYHVNLRAKIEAAPDSPSTDGLYLMKRENGENSYTPYISPIPATPSEDGTYTLTATVADGVSMLSWVSNA